MTTSMNAARTRTFPFGYTPDDHGVQGLGRMLTVEQLEQRDTWLKLHPEFKRRLIAMMHAAADEGVALGIGTGWRSFAEQQAGHERDPKGHARPGNSNHEGFPGAGNGDRDAVAADMVPNIAWNWMQQRCARFGLRTFKDINTEPWHVQPVEIPASRQRRTERWELDPWPMPNVAPPPRLVVEVAKTVLDPARRDQLLGDGDVRLLQVLALRLHVASGDQTLDVGPVDGDYGPRTQAAARRMQQLRGLAPDGVIGARSWAAILELGAA
jgi:Putative peptidoglycan binding domain/D-alanyl-D-alanine carboxypeptidase